jgi:phosphoglycerate dehydrogenase-like enzyme
LWSEVLISGVLFFEILGAVVVNTSSSHLLDDCALKEALINGTVAGVALDGIEGPQWLEAWVYSATCHLANHCRFPPVN